MGERGAEVVQEAGGVCDGAEEQCVVGRGEGPARRGGFLGERGEALGEPAVEAAEDLEGERDEAVQAVWEEDAGLPALVKRGVSVMDLSDRCSRK